MAFLQPWQPAILELASTSKIRVFSISLFDLTITPGKLRISASSLFILTYFTELTNSLAEQVPKNRFLHESYMV